MSLSRHVRGTSILLRVVVNVPSVDTAYVFIEKADGTSVLSSTSMTKSKDGVYSYDFQTTDSMALTTYVAFFVLTLATKTSKVKDFFLLIDG